MRVTTGQSASLAQGAGFFIQLFPAWHGLDAATNSI